MLFQVISTSNIDSVCQQVLTYPVTGDKKQKLSMQLSAIVQTGSGCGILGLHEGHLYLFRTFNSSRDTTMQLTPSSVVLLLEYAMVSGLDWWDIFLSVRQGMVSIMKTYPYNIQTIFSFICKNSKKFFGKKYF